MGWLTDITNWLREQIVAFWTALVAFMKDAIILLIEKVLELVSTIVAAIPVPDWVGQYTLCALLSNAGPTVMWALDTFRIGEALGLLGLGYAFRLLRKLLTLFQW